MKPENYGLKLIQSLQPDAIPIESDLMGAGFSIGNFRNTWSKMTVEQRNKMKELGWYQDPAIVLNTWVFVPRDTSEALDVVVAQNDSLRIAQKSLDETVLV